jgi:G:T-mismatch repair DNA endonuclease (very short patch repair protein)
MADMWTARKRSDVMARIRSSGNRSTELRLLEILQKKRDQRVAAQAAYFWAPGFRIQKGARCCFCGRVFLARVSAMFSPSTIK